jgi:hypothetical protein
LLALTEAIVLDNWLQELTFSGAYPIPWRAMRVDGLEKGDPTQGVLYCWTHLPLFSMPLYASIEMGYETPLIVADPGNIYGDGEFVVPGQTKAGPGNPGDPACTDEDSDDTAGGRGGRVSSGCGV